MNATLAEYAARGWSLKPVLAGQKRSTLKGWPDREFGLADFADGMNIAIRLGKHSRGLVDCDLDCEEAIELAPLYLPETGAIFGRSSAPRSHWLYFAPGAQFEAFVDPIAKETLLELRADGRDGGAHITIVPPSVADGERREWCSDAIEPVVLDARVLRRRCVALAIACLVIRYVGETAARHPEAPGWDHARLLWEVDPALGRYAVNKWLGRPAPDAPRRCPKPFAERTRIEVELDELAAAIPNDYDWHGWNTIGMAFFAASGGSDAGFTAFDHFSAKCSRYDPRETAARWCNYRRSPPSRIGKGTLIHLARQAGWRPGRRA